MSPRPAPRTVTVALIVDLVLVVVFAAIGRASHHEEVLAGLVTTSWPFLVGALAGWLVTRGWRAPLAPVRTGIGLWVTTVVIGMLLRVVSSQGVELAFIIVASIVLFVFLVGWRFAVRAIRGGRRSTR